MQNKDKFKKLDKILRSAKTPDVEVISHKANLRRALMSMPQKESGFKKSSFNFFPRIMLFGSTGLAAVAVILFGTLNLRTGTVPTSINDLSGKSAEFLQVQADGLLTDNIRRLESQNYSYVFNNSATYNEVREEDAGFSFYVPNIMNVSNTFEDSDIKISDFSYIGSWGINFDTAGIKVVRNFDKYATAWPENITSSRETVTINGKVLNIYTTDYIQSYLSNLQYYSFTARNGVVYGIGVYYHRELNSAMGDTQAIVNSDINIYSEMVDQILNSINIINSPKAIISGGKLEKTYPPLTVSFNFPENLQYDHELEPATGVVYNISLIDSAFSSDTIITDSELHNCMAAICAMDFAFGNLSITNEGKQYTAIGNPVTAHNTQLGDITMQVYEIQFDSGSTGRIIEITNVPFSGFNRTFSLRFYVSEGGAATDAAIALVQDLIASFSFGEVEERGL